MNESELPLFPLGTVLFPGGVLPLRVFETRYVDMVRERLRNDAPFGVVRITRGGEVGEPAEHEPVGCTARIVDWDMSQPGVLELRTVGGERFRVTRTRIERGLIRAQVESVPADVRVAPPPSLRAGTDLLRRAVEHMAEQGQVDRAIEPPHDFESAGWIANRLAELLPLPGATRQDLMALEDPLERLARLDALLRRSGPGRAG